MSERGDGRNWGRRDLLRILGTGAAAAALPRVASADLPRSAEGCGCGRDARACEWHGAERGSTARGCGGCGGGVFGLDHGKGVGEGGEEGCGAGGAESRGRAGEGGDDCGTDGGCGRDVGGGVADADFGVDHGIWDFISCRNLRAGKNITEANHKRFEGSGNSFGWGKKTDDEAARVIGRVDALSSRGAAGCAVEGGARRASGTR